STPVHSSPFCALVGHTHAHAPRHPSPALRRRAHHGARHHEKSRRPLTRRVLTACPGGARPVAISESVARRRFTVCQAAHERKGGQSSPVRKPALRLSSSAGSPIVAVMKVLQSAVEEPSSGPCHK